MFTYECIWVHMSPYECTCVHRFPLPMNANESKWAQMSSWVSSESTCVYIGRFPHDGKFGCFVSLLKTLLDCCGQTSFATPLFLLFCGEHDFLSPSPHQFTTIHSKCTFCSIWVHMSPYNPHESIWVHCYPWVHMSPCESMWVHTSPCESKWVHMFTYESIWVGFPRKRILPVSCHFKKKLWWTALAKSDLLGHFFQLFWEDNARGITLAHQLHTSNCTVQCFHDLSETSWFKSSYGLLFL